MKHKIYTFGHDVNLLKSVDNNGERFTAEEHSSIIKKEFNDTVFKTKENLFRHYLPLCLPKLGVLGFVVELIKQNEYTNILSLGAGPCVMEYLLKMSLPEGSKVVACDFDTFFVEKAKIFFPEIIVERFDFFKDDIISLQTKLNIKFDLVVFFDSAYVMDDPEFIKMFSDLKKAGVKKVIDSYAGYMDWKDVLKGYLRPFTRSSVLRRIFRRPPIGYQGKFHGYSRDRRELRQLYKSSGLQLKVSYIIIHT